MLTSKQDIEALRNLTDSLGSVGDDGWDENVCPETYEVEKLDYAYVRNAKDVKELKQLLGVLR
jgi:hypothetical protein